MVERNIPLFGFNFKVSIPDLENEIWKLQKDLVFEYSESEEKIFEPYLFESKARCWSFIKINGELYFLHTSNFDSITLLRMKDRSKSEFVFKGITILDVYCPRYIDLLIRKEEFSTFDNGINGIGDEDEFDFYSFLKEENKEHRKGQSKYTDFFFVSGIQSNNNHESIYLINISNFPDIKIIDQKVVKAPYLPLDKCIILNKNINSINYSVISINNNNNMNYGL